MLSSYLKFQNNYYFFFSCEEKSLSIMDAKQQEFIGETNQLITSLLPPSLPLSPIYLFESFAQYIYHLHGKLSVNDCPAGAETRECIDAIFRGLTCLT